MHAASWLRRLALGAGTAGFLGIAVLTGCSSKETPADDPMPSSGQVAPTTLSPTEKGVPAVLTPGPNAGPGPRNSPPGKGGQAPALMPGDAVTGG